MALRHVVEGARGTAAVREGRGCLVARLQSTFGGLFYYYKIYFSSDGSHSLLLTRHSSPVAMQVMSAEPCPLLFPTLNRHGQMWVRSSAGHRPSPRLQLVLVHPTPSASSNLYTLHLLPSFHLLLSSCLSLTLTIATSQTTPPLPPTILHQGPAYHSLARPPQ